VLLKVSKPLVLCISLAMFSGCGDGSNVPSAIVTGKVTLNGKPFTGAAVHFYNPSIGGGAFNLDETGTFVSSEPLTVAEYMVSLDRPGPNQGENPADIVWPEDNSGEVPPKYRSSGKSGLIARVAVGDQNNFVFAMIGKASAKKGLEGPTAFEPLSGS